MQTQQKNGGRPVAAHLARRYYAPTENWIYTQIEHLKKYEPLILTWRTENVENGLSYDCYALQERLWIESAFNRLTGKLLGYYPLFFQLLRTKQARVLHAHFGPWGYFALPLTKAANVPLITTFYGVDASGLPRQKPVWQERYQELFRFGSAFLVEGPFMGQMLGKLGCPEEKIIVQHLGVDLGSFQFKPRNYSSNTPLRVLVAGRFTEKKGIVYAIEAVAHLIKQGVVAKLTIIGDAYPGDPENKAAKHRILETIKRHDLENVVTLRGMQPHTELINAYYKHHVFLSPSVQASSGDNEGGAPVTLIEASATGMPIVATRHCDIPEVVQDGATGLLAPERDSEALAQHLLKLAACPEKLTILGQAGHQHIHREYNAEIQGQRLAKIYDEVIERHSQPAG